MCFWKRKPRPRPAPVVVQPKRILHGGYWFPGWRPTRPEYGVVPGTQCPNEHPWEVFQTDDRNMAQGKYDEADPAVFAQQLEWLVYGGFDFACVQVEWAHELSQWNLVPSYRRKLAEERGVLDPLLMAHVLDLWPARHSVKFCVDLWDVMSFGDDREAYWTELQQNGFRLPEIVDSWRQYAHMIATRYMVKESYLHVYNRPVMFFGMVQAKDEYEKRFGLTPRLLFNIIRSEVLLVTGKDPYFVATNTGEDTKRQLKDLGFQAVSDYALLGGTWEDAMGAHEHWWARNKEIAAAQGIDHWVPSLAGYDSAAWGSPQAAKCVPTPAQWKAHLARARQIAAGTSVGIVMEYALNEIGEGGIIWPMAANQLHNKDEMLLAHRDATSLNN